MNNNVYTTFPVLTGFNRGFGNPNIGVDNSGDIPQMRPVGRVQLIWTAKRWEWNDTEPANDMVPDIPSMAEEGRFAINRGVSSVGSHFG